MQSSSDHRSSLPPKPTKQQLQRERQNRNSKAFRLRRKEKELKMEIEILQLREANEMLKRMLKEQQRDKK